MHANLREFCRLMGRRRHRTRAWSSCPAWSPPSCPATPAPLPVQLRRLRQPPSALERALPELADIYDAAGVARLDGVGAGGDARRGPAAGGGRARARRRPGRDVHGAERPATLRGRTISTSTRSRAWRPVAQLNDPAYGTAPDISQRGPVDCPASRCYVARLDGPPGGCGRNHDLDGDTCILYVATLPEARGRGLAEQAADARAARGARARLPPRRACRRRRWATRLRRLGYRDLGALQMWERRVGP